MKFSNERTRILCEGAVSAALALALSYFKIPVGLSFGGFGGSIDLVMVPLIVFAFRSGIGWGISAGFVFGLLKYFLAGGTAVSWVSLILDYSAAYAMVGLAGVFSAWRNKKPGLLPAAALAGCIGRFIIHFISGITVYAEYMPESFMDKTMTSPLIYSLLYNGTYMLPNTVIAAAVCALLIPALKRLK